MTKNNIIIILDYTDASVKYTHISDDATEEDIEEILYKHFGFKESQISWMLAPEFKLEMLHLHE